MHRLPVKFLLSAGLLLCCWCSAWAEDFSIELAATAGADGYDGRVLLILSVDGEDEPRFQVESSYTAPQIFAINVSGFSPAAAVVIGTGVPGFPMADLSQLPKGEYYLQAVLHRYQNFHLANGKTVQLPAARGAGQNWRKAPGNIISQPQKIQFDPHRQGSIKVVLDTVLAPIEEPQDSEFIRHFKIRSERLSRFWGTDVYIRGHVLVPRGFDQHPQAHYPLAIFHGHFPADFGGFRTTPPDVDLECEYSKRFQHPCYNRVQQEEAYRLYQLWIADDFPRLLIVEIDHSNPYYDDSYAVNSANLGPYGDAITYEFIPALEQQFRGLGQAWARFMYGGSTGGWEALAAQFKYPDEYNGAFAACPDPIDFRQLEVTNIYADENAYWWRGPFGRVAKPAHRDNQGHLSYTAEMENQMELVLGTKSRSGAQWDIWEAVFSPMAEDGYPQRIWDKRSGKIDHRVADYWRENYDLRHILERDWATLGPKLQGKLHIYVGDMDNYYLNNAVKLMEDFLNTTDFGGELTYGDGDEHCWNGDPDLPNAVSRLRYNSMYVDKILQRIKVTAPAGADLSSWRY